METTSLENKTYYKYRSLDNFEFFLDIILKKRLYGALYRELNDPMEGIFNHAGLTHEQLCGIYTPLKKTRICSLMMKGNEQSYPDNALMWSHYADGHKGCCIEIEPTNRNNSKWRLIRVEYSDKLPCLQGDRNKAIMTILSTKADFWKDENEVRAIRTYDEDNWQALSQFYAVKIKAVYLGKKVRYDKCAFIKRIVQSIDNNIKVYKMRENESSNGYYPSLIAKEIKL